MNSLAVCLFFLAMLINLNIYAQVNKHPRAVELENHLTKSAHEFLKGRFPDKPFTVVVNVEPLHRYGEQKPQESEKIPFFDVTDSEIVDEWDDPSLSHGILLSRLKKAVVTVSVPSDLTDDEKAEIEQSIFSLLNLYKARDEVKIQLRNWGESGWDYLIWIGWAGAGLCAILLFLSGLFLVIRGSTNKLAKAIAEVQSKVNNNPALSSSNSNSVSDNKTSEKSTNLQNADLKFNDPIKMREIAIKEIEHFDNLQNFPYLADMIILDKWAADQPAEFGAFITEFSNSKQELAPPTTTLSFCH